MSIKNGLICSFVTVGLTGAACTGLFKYLKKPDTVNDDGGNVLTVSKNDNLIKLANVLVTGFGIYSFYYGYHKKNLLH